MNNVSHDNEGDANYLNTKFWLSLTAFNELSYLFTHSSCRSKFWMETKTSLYRLLVSFTMSVSSCVCNIPLKNLMILKKKDHLQKWNRYGYEDINVRGVPVFQLREWIWRAKPVVLCHINFFWNANHFQNTKS